MVHRVNAWVTLVSGRYRKSGITSIADRDLGNFYSDTLEAPGGLLEQLLNLDALPERWPLVECSPDCLCAKRCGNRPTQAGVR
jgi:histone-lysine N-methyltransferase SETMAR